MKTIPEKIEEIEERISNIEKILGLNKKIDEKKNIKKSDPNPEDKINGFQKDQLRIMYSWAKSLKLSQLTRNDFNELKNWGMLYEFYPDAPESYDDIKK